VEEAQVSEKENKKSKKRGRRGAPTVNSTKRRKNESATSLTLPSTKAAKFEPPSSDWEDDVVDIDTWKSGDNILVSLTWKGGRKSKHSVDQVYKQCPQKVSISHNASQPSKLIIYLDVEVL
jgi:chromobox protein 1